MALRTVCLCDGRYIGIEMIYTVIDGRQINIPENLENLRAKSRDNRLFCPCGCGSNLILVAGDKNLRAQHFRLKEGPFNSACDVILEGSVSIESKIVLKCWLDDKIKAADLESRVPIQAVDDSNRKYEFTFLSREKKIALRYYHERINLSDEKMELLDNNSSGISVIYIVDSENGGSNGQYPEFLMKVQSRQGYCLLLTIGSTDYSKARLSAVYYVKNIDGLWQEETFAEGYLNEFRIDESGKIRFWMEYLDEMKEEAAASFQNVLEEERKKRVKEKQHREMNWNASPEKGRDSILKKTVLQENSRQPEQKTENMQIMTEADFAQQQIQIRDAEGNRWIRCESCGKIARESAFRSYGGAGHVNLGICKICATENPVVKQKEKEQEEKKILYHGSTACPLCGGQLKEKRGLYGSFTGCSNFPDCKYNQKIRNEWR